MKRYGKGKKSRKLYEAFCGSDDEEQPHCAPMSANQEGLREYFQKQDYMLFNNVTAEPKPVEARLISLYPVPDDLKAAFDNNVSTKLEKKLDELLNYEEHLTPETYAPYFHGVLHLEEIEILKAVRNYNSSKCTLRKEGKLFVYDVRSNLQNTQFLNLGGFAKVIYENDEYNGRIVKLTEGSAFITFRKAFVDRYEFSDVSIEFHFNRMGFVRQHIAVDYSTQTLGFNMLMPTRVIENAVQLDVELIDDKIMKGDVELKWFNPDLNNYQRQAVVNIMQGKARPTPYIIFGPPGTGKTCTLIEIILQTFTNIENSQILIATPSNNGANLIAELLLKQCSFKTTELVRLHSYNTLVKSKVPEGIKKHSAVLELNQTNEKDEFEFDQPSEHSLDNKILLSEITSYRVVITTCSMMGAMQLRRECKPRYSHVFVDEAGQCIEPEALIPIHYVDPKNGQVVLAGDPKQLGPVVFSTPAKNRNLGKSFLGRILDEPLYQENVQNLLNENVFDLRLVTGLLLNYRAIPSILDVYNSMFYNSKLIATVSDENSKEIKLLTRLFDAGLLPSNEGTSRKYGLYFNNINGKNVRIPGSTSYCNVQEADKVFEFTLKLYKQNVSPDSIGIISPYKLQVAIIKLKFENKKIAAPKIGSVEEFQGQERDVILVSTVRSCSEAIQRDTRHLIGFVRSPQRINVAMSRARALCVIFGNANLLQREEYWRTIIIMAYKNGTFFGEAYPREISQELQELNLEETEGQ